MKKQDLFIVILLLSVSCSTVKNTTSSSGSTVKKHSTGAVSEKLSPKESGSSFQAASLKSLVAVPSKNPAVDTAYVRNKLPDCFLGALAEFGLPDTAVLRYFSEYNNNRCNKLFFNGVDEIINTNQYNLANCDVYALWSYTTRLYYWDLNKWLREGSNASKTAAITREIVNALNKLPKYEGGNLYRGIAIPTEELQDFLKGYKADSKNTWTSFTSCGGTESGSFAGRTTINVIFIIEHLTGKDISVFADGVRCGVPPNTPPEILIKPNSTFMSTANPSFDADKGKWLIHLKQIQ
jgi:hypothetical protein